MTITTAHCAYINNIPYYTVVATGTAARVQIEGYSGMRMQDVTLCLYLQKSGSGAIQAHPITKTQTTLEPRAMTSRFSPAGSLKLPCLPLTSHHPELSSRCCQV